MTPLSETPTSKTSKRNLAAFGVMLVIFLFAIDATIVSTAMPTIVAKLGGLELYSWVFSIYMLTSALSTPLFGKLSDLYSRRRLMLIGIAIFVLGSTLCGAAQSMEALVLFRAVQGLGGAVVSAVAQAADTTPTTNHGADVSAVAKQNHGQTVASTHRPADAGKPAAPGAPVKP